MRNHSLLFIMLAVLVCGGVGLVIGATNRTTPAAPAMPIAEKATYQLTTSEQDAPDIVDGAITPEAIPDRVAYAMMFRLLGQRETADQINRARAYIRTLVGLGEKCLNCSTQPTSGETPEADINVLLAAADEYVQRVDDLDYQFLMLKIDNKKKPNPNLKVDLKRLQRQKEAIAMEIATSLRGRLSPKGLLKTQKYVSEHVKSKIKMKSSAE